MSSVFLSLSLATKRVYTEMAFFRLSTLVLLVAYLAVGTQALYFYLEGSEKKCFIEDLPKETMVIGKSNVLCAQIVFGCIVFNSSL